MPVAVRGHRSRVFGRQKRFVDRQEAGRELAAPVRSLDLADPVVLALPRGGVPVASEVAAALDAPLDVFVALKIGMPEQPEFGVGALAEGGEPLLDEPVLSRLGVSGEALADTVAGEREELVRRIAHYRGGRPLPDLAGRHGGARRRRPGDGRDGAGGTAGLATVSAGAAGAGRARLRSRLRSRPRRGGRRGRLRAAAARIRCRRRVVRGFDQTTDEEVLDLLAAGRR